MEFPFLYKIRKVPTRPTPPTPNNFVQYGGRGAGPPQNSQGPPQNSQGPPQNSQGPPQNSQGPPQNSQGPRRTLRGRRRFVPRPGTKMWCRSRRLRRAAQSLSATKGVTYRCDWSPKMHTDNQRLKCRVWDVWVLFGFRNPQRYSWILARGKETWQGLYFVCCSRMNP